MHFLGICHGVSQFKRKADRKSSAKAIGLHIPLYSPRVKYVSLAARWHSKHFKTMLQLRYLWGHTVR